MAVSYTSIVYDLTQFGIYDIKNAIVGSDCDNNIAFEVSFDGGVSFSRVSQLNKKFSVRGSKGKIQFRIVFLDEADSNIYMVKTVGYFSNLEVGTTLYFENKKTKELFQTAIAENGRYSIYLPKGLYSVWYRSNSTKINLMPSFNPEAVVLPTKRVDKENSIELYIRDIDWVTNAIFDTFDSTDKKLIGDAIIDYEGDLSDGRTSRKCRWVVIGFE